MYILHKINKDEQQQQKKKDTKSIVAKAWDTEKIKEFKTIEELCSKYVQMSKKKNTKKK